MHLMSAQCPSLELSLTFFVNECFIEENQIIKNIDRILDIPCTIVHGQYDIVCPIRQAYDLNQVYPKSRLIVAEDAGHSLLRANN